MDRTAELKAERLKASRSPQHLEYLRDPLQIPDEVVDECPEWKHRCSVFQAVSNEDAG